jgi:hypothetical protein
LQDPNARIGQTDGFSAKDIEKLAKMYEDASDPTDENLSNATDESSNHATDENSFNDSDENSPSATRSPFITIIIVTLLVLTPLQ